jgi:hypothetical protein
MKSSTKVIIGAAAGVGLLYYFGRNTVKNLCLTQPQSVPQTILQTALQNILPGSTPTPDQQCELMVSAVPFTSIVKIGAVQFWRPITADDLA